MSAVKCTIDGWVGYTDADGNTRETLLASGDEYDAKDPIVQSRPELFEAVDAFEVPPAAPPKAPPKKATGR
jgi:hypothetical protein